MAPLGGCDVDAKGLARCRRFVATWTGGVDPDCRFRVLPDSTLAPRKAGENLIEVGAEWLRRQCVPAKALEDER
jgi:hypothetical protein